LNMYDTCGYAFLYLFFCANFLSHGFRLRWLTIFCCRFTDRTRQISNRYRSLVS
jgi:hypothetical protein